MRSPRPWCFSHPMTAATSRERTCLWMAASHECSRFIAEGTAVRGGFFSCESDGLPRAHDCPDPRDQLPRRERLRHAVVGAELEQDHVRTDLARQPQSVGAVRRQDDVVALLREVVADELGDVVLVLHQQHSAWTLRASHGVGTAAATRHHCTTSRATLIERKCLAEGLQDGDAAVNLE